MRHAEDGRGYSSGWVRGNKPFGKGNLTPMLQRYDEDSSSTPPASDGERSGRRRIFPVIERGRFHNFWSLRSSCRCSSSGLPPNRDWQDVQAEAGARITYVRDALAEHALRVFKTHELAAYAVRDRVRDRSWSRIAASADMSSFLASLAESFPEIASITLVDASGTLRAGSEAFPSEPRDFSRTRWFAQLRDEGMTRVVDTDLPDDARERGAFTLAFRLDDVTGAFDGAIRLVLSPGYFGQFYRDAYPDAGAVGLVHADGTFLIRYPPDLSLPRTTGCAIRLLSRDGGGRERQFSRAFAGGWSGAPLRLCSCGGVSRLCHVRVEPWRNGAVMAVAAARIRGILHSRWRSAGDPRPVRLAQPSRTRGYGSNCVRRPFPRRSSRRTSCSRRCITASRTTCRSSLR